MTIFKIEDFSWDSMVRWFTDWRFIRSCLFSIGILLASFVLNYYSSMYATLRASNSVSDIILSNIPVYDVEDIFIYGPLVLWGFVALLLITNPQKIPFTLKTISLFVVIRAMFVTLTHLGPFPTQTYLNPDNIISSFTTGNDLFFSGHTGLPFLLAFIFWYDMRLRVAFIATSILFGAVVLMGHFHYSIDVAAAFFITYTIYHIAESWFEKDAALFKSV
ncbi:MAG: phosphatase PAP2-related protein [Patescibacteria group bacterium]